MIELSFEPQIMVLVGSMLLTAGAIELLSSLFVDGILISWSGMLMVCNGLSPAHGRSWCRSFSTF